MAMIAVQNSQLALRASVIIVTRNSWEYLHPCLVSLEAHKAAGQEVIVIDNASGDGTVQELRLQFPGVRAISNPTNVGHCRGINQGIREARGEIIVVLDADTVLGSGVVDQLVDFLDSRPDAVIVAPRMLSPNGSVQETARAFPRVVNGLFGRQSLLTRWFPQNRFSRAYLCRSRLREQDPFPVDWVSAACMAFRRVLVEHIGYWDEGFRGYWVDADWCMRARPDGRVYCLATASVVHHEQNRSGKKKGIRRIAAFHAGVNRFYRKHYTLGLLDPRALAATVLLTARAAVLIAADCLLSAQVLPVAARAVRIGAESKGKP
jgi:N-acetylglucosaminyl-diphospho-decaprenol L-rhamnosyltransferase